LPDSSDRYALRVEDERARALSLIAKLTDDFDAVVEASREVATDDEHDPEGSTIAFERAQVDAVLTMTRAHLAELDHALVRMTDETYGRCERCGGAVGEERLFVQPAATLCVPCASPQPRRLGR
jgi:DnaK suppressor protein